MIPRVALSAVCVLSTLQHSCRAHVLAPRADKGNIPSPLSIEPAQNWEGIDGSWNTIPLRIGDPEQYTRALVSTASQQTWAIYSLACTVNQTDSQTNVTTETFDSACNEARGRTFNDSSSTSWKNIGFFQLWLEKNLGLWGNGQYGYETVGLGYTAQDGPTLKNTTVGTLITNNFWLGHFGINPKPTNFSQFSDPSPSFLATLFEQKQIPSLSWGYTAGAQYHLATVLSSLTLGGYDTSRFIPNDLTFGFAPDNERDIVVGVVGIAANSGSKNNINLLKRDQFTMYIDSTVAELYLPIEVCQAFEEAFGLKYDNNTDLYLVDDVLHETLLADNATVTFSLGQKFSTNTTVDIVLPYAALDMEAKPPYKGLENASRYFPIRRAEKENQFVLGRTFLQEAYLIVDWERQNFSVSQCNWVYGENSNIVPIVSPSLGGGASGQPTHAKSGLSTGAIIGIAVGCGFISALVAFAIVWWFWRKRRNSKIVKIEAAYASQAAAAKGPSAEKHEDPPTSPIKEEEGTSVFPKAELPGESPGRAELSTDVKERDPESPNTHGLPSPLIEVGNTERQIFEMPGDIPTRQEADGRQLSEKESMMVRERIYNGVDPTGPPPVSPTSEEAPRRPPPISPSEVTMVGRRVLDRSPTAVSPITPRTPRDGASLEANDTFFQPPPRVPRDGRFLEAEDTLLSPISPLYGPTETSRRRFSYES